MSDFIKVKFEEDDENCNMGGECILNKQNIRLYKYEEGNHWVHSGSDSLIITREEYDRLCKELGVSKNDCSHKNKNYSALAQTVCATKYRIVFWECEDCGYLEAEQPTREELGIENA